MFYQKKSFKWLIPRNDFTPLTEVSSHAHHQSLFVHSQDKLNLTLSNDNFVLAHVSNSGTRITPKTNCTLQTKVYIFFFFSNKNL